MSISKIDWHSSLIGLFPSRTSKIAARLLEADYATIYDLLWILPLHHSSIPPLASFLSCKEGEIFQGAGKIISCRTRPNYRSFGRGRSFLHNVSLAVMDHFGTGSTIELKWFNAYPNLVEKLKKIDYAIFYGVSKRFKGKLQIINPHIAAVLPDEIEGAREEKNGSEEYKIQYPTVNGVTPIQIKRLIDKIPSHCWEEIKEQLPDDLLARNNMLPLRESFKVIHGRTSGDKEALKMAKSALNL